MRARKSRLSAMLSDILESQDIKGTWDQLKEQIQRPLVISGEGDLRHGRGFSRGEAKACNSSLSVLRKLGIPTDRRRRTAHQPNITRLNEILAISKEFASHKTKFHQDL